MKSLSKYTSEIKNNNSKALVGYITAGLDGWVEASHALIENGVDIVEIGLPFSDPIMDGPVIAKASAIALANGAKTLDLISTIEKEKFVKPIVIMTYSNVLYSHGVQEIINPIERAGVSGLILPDLTFESSSIFSNELKETDISLVQLVSSTTSEKRRKEIALSSEGFLYCVAIKGITGQNVDLSSTYTSFVEPIREISPVPTYCGVGIRTDQDAKNLSELSDGVIVGTSLVEKLLEGTSAIDSLGDFVQELRTAIDTK